jgi:hypothetical protein
MTVSRLGVGGCGPVVIKPAMGTGPLLDCGPFPDLALNASLRLKPGDF